MNLNRYALAPQRARFAFRLAGFQSRRQGYAESRRQHRNVVPLPFSPVISYLSETEERNGHYMYCDTLLDKEK